MCVGFIMMFGMYFLIIFWISNILVFLLKLYKSATYTVYNVYINNVLYMYVLVIGVFCIYCRFGVSSISYSDTNRDWISSGCHII